jgi:hypothetical protein
MIKIKIIIITLIISSLFSFVYTQTTGNFMKTPKETNFIKKSKEPKSYIGIGYSFVGFTNKIMSIGYPFLDAKSGDFVSELNFYYGYNITKALAIEIEPSISFSRNYRYEKIDLIKPYFINNEFYNYDFPVRKSYSSYPLAVNLKLFPFSKSKGFGRALFIGGSAGVIFVKEEYDHRFTNNVSYVGSYDTTRDVAANISSSSQWHSLFRALIGIRVSGRIIDFGGEIRYTFIALTSNGEPFRTRIATNANSLDIALRLYYGL